MVVLDAARDRIEAAGGVLAGGSLALAVAAAAMAAAGAGAPGWARACGGWLGAAGAVMSALLQWT